MALWEKDLPCQLFRAAMSEESARPAKGRSLITAVTVTKDKWRCKYFLIRHRILNVSILNQQVGWENRCPVSLIKHGNGWVESVYVIKADRNCSPYLFQAVTKDRNLSIFCKGMVKTLKAVKRDCSRLDFIIHSKPGQSARLNGILQFIFSVFSRTRHWLVVLLLCTYTGKGEDGFWNMYCLRNNQRYVWWLIYGRTLYTDVRDIGNMLDV